MDDAGLDGINVFDVVFAALVAVCSLVGLFKGLTRLVVGMTALVAAFLVAAARHAQVGGALAARFEVPPLVASVVAYAMVFLTVMLFGALVLPLARAVVRMTTLAWLDRFAGLAAGLCGAVLIAGSVVLPVLAYVPAGDRVLAESQLAPYATFGAELVAAMAPPEIGAWYRERMAGVESLWRERAEAARLRRRPGPGEAPPLDPPLPGIPWR